MACRRRLIEHRQDALLFRDPKFRCGTPVTGFVQPGKAMTRVSGRWSGRERIPVRF